MKRLRRVFQIAAVGVFMLCGQATAQEDQPSADAVAQVGIVAISADDFAHWLGQAVHSHFQRPVELVAPRYEHCVAVKRRQRRAKGWRGLSAPMLRNRCAHDHRSLRRITMQFLVQAQWVEQEAARRGVEVGKRRVDRVFNRQRRSAFPTRASYERFLRESGASEEGIKYRVRLDMLQNRVTRRIIARARPVVRRDVARYRARHPKEFANMGSPKANRKARSLLVSHRQQLALARFIDRFRNRYRGMTSCADGYEIAECGAGALSSPAD